MKEHYATRLKAKIKKLETEKQIAMDCLIDIAMSKGFDSPSKVADKTLRKLGRVPLVLDEDMPEDTIVISWTEGLSRKPVGYI